MFYTTGDRMGFLGKEPLPCPGWRGAGHLLKQRGYFIQKGKLEVKGDKKGVKQGEL